MLLYHGSEKNINNPQYGLGKRTNDYGRGFYCTEDIEMAKEWACGDKRDGWVSHYDFDVSGLAILNLNSEEYNVLNWLAILAKNRTYWQNGSISFEAKKYLEDIFLLDISDYDVIIGYRADDSYFSFAQDFVSGVISLQQLSKAMRLGRLGEQVVLKSKNAFKQIKYFDKTIASADKYYPRRIERDRSARTDYKRMREETNINDLFMLDIMREGIVDGDSRLLI